MDRTGRNENTIARLRVNRVQALLGLASLYRAGQVLSRNIGFEPRVQHRAWFRIDDVPSLGFAQIRTGHLQPVSVVGMDLNTQIVLAIEVLEQQREAGDVRPALRAF